MATCPAAPSRGSPGVALALGVFVHFGGDKALGQHGLTGGQVHGLLHNKGSQLALATDLILASAQRQQWIFNGPPEFVTQHLKAKAHRAAGAKP